MWGLGLNVKEKKKQKNGKIDTCVLMFYLSLFDDLWDIMNFVFYLIIFFKW